MLMIILTMNNLEKKYIISLFLLENEKKTSIKNYKNLEGIDIILIISKNC